MLKIDKVSKRYRTSKVQTDALREISFEVKEGEFVAIQGPSGSGKTTLLNVMGLLESFDGGDYTIDGNSVKDINDDRQSSIRNEKIGFIFQNYNLLPDLPIYDNVEVPLHYRGLNSSERKKRVVEALETVGLGSRLSHYPNQLSGGQQQRVAIARALAGEPRLLLADEPTGNLDSMMADQIMDLLDVINRDGTTIVMVTHEKAMVKRAGRVLEILDGELLQDTVVPRLRSLSKEA